MSRPILFLTLGLCATYVHSSCFPRDKWHVERRTLHYPRLDEVARVLGRNLRKQFKYVQSDVVYCPDLRREPFNLANKGVPYGIEEHIFVEYSNRFNFSIKTNTNAFGYVNILDLDINDTHFVELGVSTSHNTLLDQLPIKMFHYIAMVPIPLIKSDFFTLLNVFHELIWLLIVCVIIIVNIWLFWWRRLTNINFPYLSIYGYMVNQCSLLNIQTKTTLLKYIIILLLIFNILLTTAYNSRLSSVLVAPVFEKNINTIQDLAKSQLKSIFLEKKSIDILPNKDIKKLFERLNPDYDILPNGTTSEHIEKLIARRDYFVVTPRHYGGGYVLNDKHLTLLYGKYKPSPIILHGDYVYFQLRKNSMHTIEVARIYQDSVETGIAEFWLTLDLIRSNLTIIQSKIKGTEKEAGRYLMEKEELEMEHLKGIFASWGFGLVFSLVIFCLEVVVIHI